MSPELLKPVVVDARSQLIAHQQHKQIEILKGTKKYVVGGIYRHPGYKIDSFMSKFECILSQVMSCKLPCLIARDLNTDLKKFQCHQDTKAYFDSLIVNNFAPVTVMPTRITDKSSTLTNHIYYSDDKKVMIVALLQQVICGVTLLIISLILFFCRTILR